VNTPWGRSDSIRKIQFGVSWVGTPSHGGLAISKGQASKLLSEKALSRLPGHIVCEQYGDYFFFEEDCAYAIAFLEHPEWKRYLDKLSLAEWENSVFDADSYMGKAKSESVPKLQAELAKTNEQIKQEMEQIVRHWFPEYFGESKVQS